MTHTRAWMRASMQTYIHGPLYVCLLYLSLFLGLCIFVYFCSLSSPACVYGFRCGCISRGVLLSVCLTACLRVSLCLLINLHLWSAVPGVSFAVWVLCVRVNVTWILSLLYYPCLSVDGSRLVIFKLGENDGLGRLWCQAAILMTCLRLGLPGLSEWLPPSAMCSRVLKTR